MLRVFASGAAAAHAAVFYGKLNLHIGGNITGKRVGYPLVGDGSYGRKRKAPAFRMYALGLFGFAAQRLYGGNHSGKLFRLFERLRRVAPP